MYFFLFLTCIYISRFKDNIYSPRFKVTNNKYASSAYEKNSVEISDRKIIKF